MAQVKEREGGGVFLVLVSFLARPKPKVPFLGLSSLQNQTETLATQATISLDPRTLYRLRPSFCPLLLSCSLLYNTTLLTKQRTVTSIFCCLIRKCYKGYLLLFSQLFCWFSQKGCLNLTNCYVSFHDYKSIWIDILSMLTLVDTNTPVCLFQLPPKLHQYRSTKIKDNNSSLCREFPDGAQSFVYCSRNNCDGINQQLMEWNGYEGRQTTLLYVSVNLKVHNVQQHSQQCDRIDKY